MKILVIEDNVDILKNVTDFLDLRGFTTDCAEDGLTGLHLAATQDFDLIILDLMLPGIDGLTLCQRLRKDAKNRTPIIMLTAKDSIQDKLAGFEAGADDYLVKPFDLSELKARIDVLLKRSWKASDGNVLQVGDLVFDTSTLEVQRAGIPIKLGPIGLKILERMMRASPEVVTKESLSELIWGDEPCESDALRTHVHHLRQCIDKPFKKNTLITVTRIGYRLLTHSHEI
jgi:DNA-binding response OmpR family regulator